MTVTPEEMDSQFCCSKGRFCQNLSKLGKREAQLQIDEHELGCTMWFCFVKHRTQISHTTLPHINFSRASRVVLALLNL